jgi:hypothetical protein
MSVWYRHVGLRLVPARYPNDLLGVSSQAQQASKISLLFLYDVEQQIADKAIKNESVPNVFLCLLMLKYREK